MNRQTIKLSAIIFATREKVWETLLEDNNYRNWVSVFMPGSYAEGGWGEGNKIYFKAPDGNGMVSMVKKHKPNEIITFEHIGILNNNTEEYDSEESLKWKGTKETYSVNQNTGKTELFIEHEIAEEYAVWFGETWQKAIEKIKEMAETN